MTDKVIESDRYSDRTSDAQVTDQTTCKHCGESMAARGANGSLKTFCSSRCNGDYRRYLNRQKQQDMADRAEAALERNARLLNKYLQKRRRRLARTERMAA